MAYAFDDESRDLVEASWKVARPDGKAPIPIGPCFADGCPGVLHVIVDRDRPMDPASLSTWRPNAMCHRKDTEGKYRPNRDHQIDAKVYAADLARHAEVPNDTDVIRV